MASKDQGVESFKCHTRYCERQHPGSRRDDGEREIMEHLALTVINGEE